MPCDFRHRILSPISLALAVSCSLLAAAARGGEAKRPAEKQSAAPRYETHVAPIFKANCVRCHNRNAMKAELDLSTPEGIFKGGESGAIIALGKLDESLLYDMVHEELMPPEEDRRLTKADVETIGRWIEAGAPFVEKIDPKELSAAGEVSNHDIEPLMLLRCAVCHGLRKQEAGLDLRTKASMLKGGKSGPAIVLGNPGESLLLKRIHAGEMPPREKLISASVRPMTTGDIDKLTRWIELGAPETHVELDVATTDPDPLVTAQDRKFWSFQPPHKAPVPTVENAARVRNPVDAFLLRKLEAAGLGFSPEADKLTLLRRVSFDLTGLPPGREQIDAYLADEAPQAYERMVDRVLASKRYGERSARRWLDLAGYADSEGKRSADPIRPNAYRYRDYVIRSFNDDKPYDRFLLEQIAGDELVDYEHAKTLTQPLIDNLVATGFLRMAPDGTGSDIVNHVPERLEVIADEIDIFSSTVLGLTMKCARCHSHKYDPIPHRDYYRLMAVFKGAYDEHDWLKPTVVVGQSKSTSAGRVIPLATEEQRREVETYNAKVDDWIAEAEDEFKQQAKKLQDEMQVDAKALQGTTEYQAAKRKRDLRVRDLKGRKLKEPAVRACGTAAKRRRRTFIAAAITCSRGDWWAPACPRR